MSENPPALPGTLSRPDAQRIIDALNLRLHEAEQKVEALEGKFPVATANIAKEAVTDEKLASPIIRGKVSSAGAVVLGSGFSAEKTGTGIYKITLTTELATEGTLVATPTDQNRAIRNSAQGKKSFTVNAVSLAEAAADTGFNFLIIKS